MAKMPWLAIFLATFHFQTVVNGQYFSPDMTDKAYLDTTHIRVKREVVQSRLRLEEQTEVVQLATKAYIGAKIKENLFKALRILAEKELETLSMQSRPRQPRQDEDGEDDPGLIPQLASIVQAIFGNNVNVTKYVESASKLLPRPIGSQLVGIVSLLDPNQFTTTRAPAFLSPANPNIIINQSVSAEPAQQTVPSNGVQQPINGAHISTELPVPVQGLVTSTQATAASLQTSPRPAVVGTDGDEDEDGIRLEEDDGRRLGRQFKGVNPMQLLSGMESIWKNFQPYPNETSSSIEIAHVKAGVTTESPDGFDDDYTTRPSRTKVVLTGVMEQAQNLRKGVPDLFEGAREAYKFLETINGFLDKWSARLAAGSVDDD